MQQSVMYGEQISAHSTSKMDLGAALQKLEAGIALMQATKQHGMLSHHQAGTTELIEMTGVLALQQQLKPVILIAHLINAAAIDYFEKR